MRRSPRIVIVIIGAVLVIAALLFFLRDRGASHAAASVADAPSTAPRATSSPHAASAPPAAQPTSAADAGTSAASSHVVARLGWGSGPDQLGRSHAQEGNPEAPMSLAAGPDGTIVVLDQVNGRLVRFGRDGRSLGTTALPLQAPQDVVLAQDGTTLVLDRLSDRAVALLDPNGQQRGELPIVGKGVPEGGAVTGLFVDGDKVYVEKEHGALVRIGNTSGEADSERPEIPGRPSRDGRSYLSAGIVDAAAGRLFVTSIARDSGEQRFTRELRLGGPVLALLLLDSDRRGVIYLAASMEQGSGGGPSVLLTCLAPDDGRPLGRLELPANTDADETFRELTVTDDGSVLYLHRTAQGAQLERWSCP